MTEFSEPPNSSATTGLQRLGPTLGSLIGPQPGEHGSVARRMDPAKVASHLAKQAPTETDANLVDLLEQRHGLRLEVEWESRFPEDGGYYTVAVAARGQKTREDADVAGALAVVEEAMTPALPNDLACELAQLRVLTKARDGSPEDMELMAQAYLDQLRRYPADVALSVIRDWPRTRNGKWWPSWHELERWCSARASARHAMRARLKRALDNQRRAAE